MKHYSKKSIDFLNKAVKQKKPEWLDKNKTEYQDVLVEPTAYLVQQLQAKLGSKVRGYKFPKRFAIIKRNSIKAREQGWYKDWISVGASRPSGSLFEETPGLYFHASDEYIFCGGGLYMATSAQIKKIREWILQDPSELKALFADKKFKARFKSLNDSKKLKTNPRGIDIHHPDIEWLRLQAFFVSRKYSKKEFFAKNFSQLLAKDFEQILRLNSILNHYLTDWPKILRPAKNQFDAVHSELDSEWETGR